MEYRFLGRTGLKVSRLCFGALTIGPLQAKLPLPAGAAVIRAALAAGVNFIDTADLYGTYPYIREALQGSKDVILASKSYAYTYEDMRSHVERALTETGRDYIDIFMLHEQVSRHTLRGHHDALVYLLDAKAKGLVEKPAPDVAPSTLSIIGRYILHPEVFEYLDRKEKGAGGEIQLTDAISQSIGTVPFHGMRFEGTRYDCGDKVGWLEANVAFALEREDIGAAAREALRRFSF